MSEYIEIDAVPTCDMSIADLVECARPFAKSIELDGDAFLLTSRNQTTGGTRVERLDGFRLVQRVLAELERALCMTGDDVVETSRVVNDVYSKSRRFADGVAMTLFDFIDAETEPPGAASFVARTCRVLGESVGSDDV